MPPCATTSSNLTSSYRKASRRRDASSSDWERRSSRARDTGPAVRSMRPGRDRLGALEQQLEERVEAAAHALDLLDRRVDAQLVEQPRDLRPPHRQEVARVGQGIAELARPLLGV